ncbi:4267_t:CDS:2, partial [Funneliformis geosporum]
SSKALKISQLRADITYKHHLNNNSSQSTFFEPILLDKDITNDEAAILIEEEHDKIHDESDNEAEFQLENEFNEYLQNWAEMLEEERISIFDENFDENNTIDNIIHPAIDFNAKWKL